MMVTGWAVWNRGRKLLYYKGDSLNLDDRDISIICIDDAQGNGPEQLDKPVGIEIVDGLLYVADRRNDRIPVFHTISEYGFGLVMLNTER